MMAYLLRRLAYVFPILMGVNLITFFLFFVVNTPEQMARVQLGEKRVSEEAIEQWKQQRGYDKPLFINLEDDSNGMFSDTIFYQQTFNLMRFDFGRSDTGRSISKDITERMWPSLALQLPSLVLGMLVAISFALLVIMFRATAFDAISMSICVFLMSISGVFYILAGQFLFARMWNWVPISGFLGGIDMLRFLALPIFIGVVAGIGSGTRLYRSIFLEEANQDYVRTARAKGVSELGVLFKHVLANGMIPILTSVVVVIPSLFMGSLLMESFFSIPGLGSYMLDAIQAQDFAVVKAMVFLGSVLYILGLLLTDISYALADPRVRFS